MNRLPCLLASALLLWSAAGRAPAVADEALHVTLGKEAAPTVYLWLESSLARVFPQTQPGAARLELLAPRNGTVSFQACLRNERDYTLRVDGAVEGADDLAGRTRLVGLVPAPHHTNGTTAAELDGVGHIPGLVPDPLYPETKTLIGQHESRSYWITLRIPADAEPGKRELKFRFYLGDHRQEFVLPVSLEISPFIVKPRENFPVTHWWRGEATWDHYKTGMFEDERWWQLTRDQLKNMYDHGSNVVYVPMYFNRRETFKRPCQLLVVNEPQPGRYEFDWKLVKRFVDLCREIGFREFEWPHMWIYWGVENPMRIYTKADDRYVMLWPPETSAFSDVYVNYLRQFLPEFHDFLKREDLLGCSYFHLSDEPGAGQHVENYKRARQILRELAPWMKVMDALSDIDYGKQGLTDIPIPMVSAAQAYIEAGIPHWVYYCCSPSGPWLNRFLDTPLAKIRMSGWLFYKLRARGFLHWGFNYWHALEQERSIDPFTELSGDLWPGIPYGDPFMIYPGPDGPIDSLRWEVFAESLQDYAILQTAGIDPGDALLEDIKTYGEFPKNRQWIEEKLRRILQAGAAEPSATAAAAAE
ncbi:MAG: hypothetical protein DCC67_01310 [Planctomycetota bacterium]|nr:MAG: hypothetical protein DCC67_01310 [Planctomycetota bacterium]